MKSWRRSGSHSPSSSAPSPPPPPVTIISVVADGDGAGSVGFSVPVTWDGTPEGTFIVNGQAVSWGFQEDATHMQGQVDHDWNPGDEWSWSGPDPTLTPTPDSSQSGNST